MEYITEQTVRPEDVLSIAQLFLRWKHDIARKIIEKFYIMFQSSEEEHPLRIFKFVEIYYQDTPRNSDGYQGFLLKLEPLILLKCFPYKEMITEFSSFFVLKQDILNVERTNREFSMLPAGGSAKLHGEFCTPQNLHMLGPQVFARLFNHENERIPSIEEMTISKRQVWPWLGPVIMTRLGRKEPKGQEIANLEEYLTEIAHFIKAARQVGQEDAYCLGKMVRHRYPKINNQKLVELIDPKPSRNKAAIKKQANRWLTWEEMPE